MLLRAGFGMFDRLGGISAIQAHVASLSEYLYKGLAGLKHSNGAPIVQIFGKHHLSNARQVRSSLSSPLRRSISRTWLPEPSMQRT
jgi:molybdenum cofactor sulfurtransferase